MAIRLSGLARLEKVRVAGLQVGHTMQVDSVSLMPGVDPGGAARDLLEGAFRADVPLDVLIAGDDVFGRLRVLLYLLLRDHAGVLEGIMAGHIAKANEAEVVVLSDHGLSERADAMARALLLGPPVATFVLPQRLTL